MNDDEDISFYEYELYLQPDQIPELPTGPQHATLVAIEAMMSTVDHAAGILLDNLDRLVPGRVAVKRHPAEGFTAMPLHCKVNNLSMDLVELAVALRDMADHLDLLDTDRGITEYVRQFTIEGQKEAQAKKIADAGMAS
jgi:hypothetical protein